MKLSLTKAEKIVILIGIVIVALILVLGFAKNTFAKNEEYVPKEESGVNESETTQTTSGKLATKNDTFVYVIGEMFDESASTYINGSSDGVTMDFSNVLTSVPGTYEATASKDNEQVKFKVIVAETRNPIITIVNPEVVFTIEQGSTIKELTDFVNATAVDVYGNNLTSSITGLPTSFPAESLYQEYTLNVKDKDGNTASAIVRVSFYHY